VRADARLRGKGVGETGRRVAEEQRALPGLEIDGFIAVHVPEARAGAAGEVERDGLFALADTAVDAAGDALLGALEEAAGVGKGIGHGGRDSVVTVNEDSTLSVAGGRGETSNIQYLLRRATLAQDRFAATSNLQ